MNGGLAIQAHADIIEHAGADLIGVTDAGVLICERWWRPRPRWSRPKAPRKREWCKGACILERPREQRRLHLLRRTGGLREHRRTPH